MIRHLALALPLLSVGCSAILGPGSERVVATLAGFNADDPRVEMTVVGSTVHVAVSSYGNGCVSKGSTEVHISGRTADVRPYDVRRRARACESILRTFHHEATIPFAGSGPVTVRVHGRDARLSTVPIRVLVERVLEIP